jgi:hypothetical protein
MNIIRLEIDLGLADEKAMLWGQAYGMVIWDGRQWTREVPPPPSPRKPARPTYRYGSL